MFIKRFGPWFNRRGYWYDQARREDWTKSDEKHYHAEIFPVLGALCEKWKVANLFPPGWRFDRRKGRRRTGRGTVEIPTIIAPAWDWDRLTFRRLIKLGFIGTADLAKRYRNVVLAEFDLNWPTKDLLDYAKRVLAYARENYETELQEQGLKVPRSRRRIQDYGIHLKIWDLKQEGKSVPEIARLVFPNELPSSALQKVRDRLRAAGRLISGHPQEIR